MKPKSIFLGLVACIVLTATVPAHASNLYNGSNWAALASDRKAHNVGDVITILVYENASASNQAGSESSKEFAVAGSVGGYPLNKNASIGLSGGSDSSGATSRSGKMVAQIGAMVTEILPNGNLMILGEQYLKVNGETSLIRVRGQIRPEDISRSNTIISARIANAEIDFDGKGFVSKSARPGLLTRLFRWLGLA